MTRQQRKILSSAVRATTITAAAKPAAQVIRAAWDATVTISAENPSPNPAAKLDTPDAAGGKGEPGQSGGKQVRASDGKPPVPRFTMSAYNGGPMKLNGYRFPVVVDGTGIKAAAANIPIYCGHCQSYESPSTQMELLMGQTDSFSVDQATGEVTACGPITGESDTVKSAQAHARNGFKFQASINALPSKIDFIPEGVQANVNGRPITGPCVIARAVTCDHIAIVPMGADTSTTASIAAEAAKGTVMEFAAWLTAIYAIEAATLTAAQKAKFEAEFNRISASPAAPSADPAVITAAKPAIVDDTNTIIAARRAAIAADDVRIAAVQTAAKGFPEISAKAVSDGWTVDKTELEILRAERKARTKGNDGALGAVVSADFIPKDGLGGYRNLSAKHGGRYEDPRNDEMARVLESVALISAGYSAEKLSKSAQYGERTMDAAERVMQKHGHGFGPMGLMRLVAQFNGQQLPDGREEAYRQITASISTMSLPTILSNVMNKLLIESYTSVDPDFGAEPGVAWKKFVKQGPVQDFKPHYRVRLTGDMAFQSLGRDGEIQHGVLSEQSYTLQADTKAILFGLSRKDLINDDQSVLSTTPQQVGIGAGETIARFIYGLLMANSRLGYQSDGSTAFFTATAITAKMSKMAKNLLASSALSITTLGTAFAQFMLQTKPNGAPLGLMPKIMLVPPGLRTLAMQLYTSTDLIPAFVSTAGSPSGIAGKNVLANQFKPVCSGLLADASQADYAADCLTNWYLMAAATDVAYPVEAGFLNGQQMPIIERDEMTFDRLGIAFRGFIDFGASMGEPRSAVLAQA